MKNTEYRKTVINIIWEGGVRIIDTVYPNFYTHEDVINEIKESFYITDEIIQVLQY